MSTEDPSAVTVEIRVRVTVDIDAYEDLFGTGIDPTGIAIWAREDIADDLRDHVQQFQGHPDSSRWMTDFEIQTTNREAS